MFLVRKKNPQLWTCNVSFSKGRKNRWRHDNGISELNFSEVIVNTFPHLNLTSRSYMTEKLLKT